MINQMFDDWSPVMIYQKIREIDNALEQLWKRYCDDKADLLDEKQQLMDAISNKSYVGDLGNKPVMADTNNPTITFTNKQTGESFDVKAIKYTPDKDGWRTGAHVENENNFIEGR